LLQLFRKTVAHCFPLSSLSQCLYLDDELTLRELTWDLLRWHEMLQPFGQGNPQPLFLVRRVEPIAPPKILKEKHLVLRFGRMDIISVRSFSAARRSRCPLPPWDVAFRISRDEYEGEARLQMEVEALRATIPTEP
jgi:single-stranded-DNA-specific exonuclease